MSQADNPYASPQETSTPTARRSSGHIVPYVSGHFRAMCAVVMLSLGILADVALFGSCWSQCDLLEQVQQGKTVTPAAANANDARQAMLAGVDRIIFLITAVMFLAWVYRAHRNLPALGLTHLEFTSAGAVAWYFCPIASYFKPYMAMREIAVGSDPERTDFDDPTFRPGRNLPILPWWWGGFVVMCIVGTFLNYSEKTATIDDLLNGTKTAMFALVVGSVAAILAILVVLGIDGRQDERYRKICEEPPRTISPLPQPSHGVDEFLNSLE